MYFSNNNLFVLEYTCIAYKLQRYLLVVLGLWCKKTNTVIGLADDNRRMNDCYRYYRNVSLDRKVLGLCT